MEERKWRFPLLGGGQMRGFTDGDSETFKANRNRSFAREIIQNSIDVRENDSEPVRIEFEEFYLNPEEILDVDNYIKGIQGCINLCNYEKAKIKTYQNMLDIIDQDKSIPCLRISDFNTSGLVGVDSDELRGNQFLSLVKGTGFSTKREGVTGGSKGVGKNAPFLLSMFNTIFYSTNTGTKKGTIGVAKFITGLNPDGKKTQGTGYWSNDNNCSAVMDLFPLQKGYNKRNNNKGTDLFILGIQKTNTWDKDLLVTILDDYMHAIVHNDLEISLNTLQINKDTIDSIVNHDLVKDNKSIQMQYKILKEKVEVHSYNIETTIGDCSLYVHLHKKGDEGNATKECAIIRYPGMKIMSWSKKHYDVSAICIIRNNNLGQRLLEIENVEHTQWQINRITNLDEKRELQSIINTIKGNIDEYINELFEVNSTDEIDPIGAGEHLPGEFGTGENNSSKKNFDDKDEVTVSKLKENILNIKDPLSVSDQTNSLEPHIGKSIEEGEGTLVPEGHNETSGGESKPGSKEVGFNEDGEDIIFKNAALKGTKYRIITTNKNSGAMNIIFQSTIDHNNCFMRLNLLDDGNKSHPVKIKNINIEGIDINSDNNELYGPFKLKSGQKVCLKVVSDMRNNFAGEVIIKCK